MLRQKLFFDQVARTHYSMCQASDLYAFLRKVAKRRELGVMLVEGYIATTQFANDLAEWMGQQPLSKPAPAVGVVRVLHDEARVALGPVHHLQDYLVASYTYQSVVYALSLVKLLESMSYQLEFDDRTENLRSQIVGIESAVGKLELTIEGVLAQL